MWFAQGEDSSSSEASEEITSWNTKEWISAWASAEKAWDYVTHRRSESEELFFFRFLQLSQDGGLNKITGTKDPETDVLWYWSRYLSALMTFVFLVSNTIYIIWVDVAVLQNRYDLEMDDGWLLVRAIPILKNKAHLQVQITCGVELAIFAYLWAKALVSVSLATCCRGWRRWYHIQSLFFDQIPALSVFSALQLLFYCTPKVLLVEIFAIIFYDQQVRVCRLARELLFAFVCFVVGFDAFLIKFREASGLFIVGRDGNIIEELEFENFFGSVMLLNQILGVVQLHWIVRRRVYRFIFAGEDCIFTDEETVKMNVWNALVAKTICDKYANFADKIAMLMTFCDDDVQMLILGNKMSLSK